MSTSVWTDAEQSLLEEGLVKFVTKVDLTEKWEAVAGHVGSKSAEECAQRYKEGQKASLKRSRRGEESSWNESKSTWDAGSGWKWSKKEGWTWDEGWNGWQEGGWSTQDWGAEGQEAEEDPEEGLTDEQKRALQMKREVEANRERLRKKLEKEEEEKRRREAKEKAIQDEKEREVREKREAREKEFEAARQQAAEKKRQEQELIAKAKQAAQKANPAFAPRAKGKGAATELSSWAAKANAAKKGEAMRLKKEQELERQSAAVLANIAASKPRSSTSTAAAAASSSSEAPKSKAKAKARAKPPKEEAPPPDEDEGEDEKERSSEEEEQAGAPAAAASKRPPRRSEPIGPRAGGADHVAKSGGAGKWWERRWWSELDGDCPISLAPLADLPGEPFGLDAEGSSEKHYFDARFLANYLLSSGDFIDPVNRQPLTYEECKRLDDHLLRHHPKEVSDSSVADTFALFEKHGVASRDSEEVHAVQREATAILGHLFRFQTARRPEQQPHRRRGRQAADAQATDGAGAAAAAASAAGPFGAGSSSVAAAAAEWQPPPDDREDEQAFPSLPGAKAKAKPQAKQSPAGGGGSGKGKANTTRFGGGAGGKKGGGKGGTFARRSAWGSPA